MPTNIFSHVRSSLLQRRAAIEQDIAVRRANLLEADHVLAALDRLPGRIDTLRKTTSEAPVSPVINYGRILEDGNVNSQLRDNRLVVNALDELAADIPAAKKFWQARRKDLAA